MPDRRYLRLGGGLLRHSPDERSAFVRGLAQAAHDITPRELQVLFEGGWRERRTAAWLAAVAHRTEFRTLLGRLLLDSEGPYAGQAYCVALATFGSAADAELLRDYLDVYLARPDLYYDQVVVLVTLEYLDDTLGSAHAARFLVPGGPWERLLEVRGGPGSDPQGSRQYSRQVVEGLCAVVAEAATVLASLNRES
ncbi:hypothetical protein GTW71_29750 [Streptomyces sp. SID6041]|nr:hypothetical protein [Streptomyces sp. SID6041]